MILFFDIFNRDFTYSNLFRFISYRNEIFTMIKFKLLNIVLYAYTRSENAIDKSKIMFNEISVL